MTFAEALRRKIELKYSERGDQLGWRLLYSPASVLVSAEVAFIGLNPGGEHDEPDHPSFACAPGQSAYIFESWKGRPSGEEALQRQVRLLFGRIGVEATDVLAGNLVPFRSPGGADRALDNQPGAKSEVGLAPGAVIAGHRVRRVTRHAVPVE